MDEGVELLQQSLPRMIADRLELYSGAAAVALVEGLAIRQRIEDALDVDTNPKSTPSPNRATAGKCRNFFAFAASFARGAATSPGAEQDLHAAMDLAEQQSALSWSLRVAASRARLAIEPKARADAVSDLKRIYARFVEGFETTDLRDVREIVQAIRIARPPRPIAESRHRRQVCCSAQRDICRRSQQLTTSNNP